jgi:predicted peroxiredoxin
MATRAPPLGVLLLSGGHERAHYALVLATAAAALGREAVLFATNAGCRLFLDPTPLLAEPHEAALEARGVAGIGTLLQAASELGLRRIVCEAGLRAEDLAGQPLAPGVEVAGIVTFLSAVGEGQMLSI